jgi:hypothetical protein
VDGPLSVVPAEMARQRGGAKKKEKGTTQEATRGRVGLKVCGLKKTSCEKN